MYGRTNFVFLWGFKTRESLQTKNKRLMSWFEAS